MSVHFSSKSNEWTTPQHLFDELNREYHFTLDPCATHENAKCEKYFTEKENGLLQDWSDDVVFMNPPYGREIKQWIKKAYEETLNGATVVCLIPARTDTTYWHDYIFGKAFDIRFLKGRLKFGDSKNSAPFPSAIVVYKCKE
ncbi:DNA N-6-adenine-methyltransferase [Staphylococcus capitis]|uniref:DNA N-6-adenine-methyltransferase n=1 Tax=Staphylococcus capitis TaxID=29388 RepID=UPI002878477E|nr:DNA N-6-adenine-methyltransferase [Staphylococcus capitis]MDS4067844.1 DNA N-6-adenine-methyltransferase [Staphylococcus capitis]